MSLVNVFISSSAKDHRDLDYLRMRLFEIEHKVEYKRKWRTFHRLLQRVKASRHTYENISKAGQCVFGSGDSELVQFNLFEIQRLRQKELLLTNLLSLTQKLAYDYDEKTDLEARELEFRLVPLLDEFDERIKWNLQHELYHSFLLEPYLDKDLTELHSVRTRITSLFTKVYHKPIRDIRRYIRSIIRFLFTAMDDEYEVADVLVYVSPITSIKTSIHYHEFKRKERFS